MLMRREAACGELSLHSRASAAPRLLVAQVAPLGSVQGKFDKQSL